MLVGAAALALMKTAQGLERQFRGLARSDNQNARVRPAPQSTFDKIHRLVTDGDRVPAYLGLAPRPLSSVHREIEKVREHGSGRPGQASVAEGLCDLSQHLCLTKCLRIKTCSHAHQMTDCLRTLHEVQMAGQRPGVQPRAPG